MIYIGIDPGEEGALAALDFGLPKERYNFEIFDCPKTLQERWNLLESILDNFNKNIIVAIEKASKTIRIGKKTYHATVLWGNYQAWLVVLICLNIRHEIVPARRWQTILETNKKLSTKERAWETACRLYPEAIPMLKGPRGAKKFGRSDALMIAEWARRNLK